MEVNKEETLTTSETDVMIDRRLDRGFFRVERGSKAMISLASMIHTEEWDR